MRFLKAYLNYMDNPCEMISLLVKQRAWGQICLGYLVAALGWVVFFNIGDGLSLAALLLKIFLVFVAEVTAGYFIAALTALFLDFKKSPISPAELFALVGTAGYLKGLLIAGALISALFPNAHFCLFAPIYLLVVFLIQLCFLVHSVRQMQQMSVGTAICAWILGVLPIGFLFALVGMFFVWGMMLLV